MRFVTKVRSTVLFAALAVAGCAESEPTEGGAGQLELSTNALVLGQSFAVMGTGFKVGDAGKTRLIFEGSYTTDRGETSAVNLSMTPIYDGEEVLADGTVRQVLRVNRFGPFSNPFSATDRPGLFQGTVYALIEDADGTVSRGAESRTEIAVEPSIVIEALHPYDAACSAPAMRALAGVPYTLRVRAVGIKATRFEYEIGRINDIDGVARFVHDFGRGNPVASDVLSDPEDPRLDTDGFGELILFNPIEAGTKTYVTSIRIKAFDDAGASVETVLPLSVHRPIEVSYEGKREMAELFEPVPVSSCTVGGINTTLNYSETRSESRQRSVSMTASSSFLQSTGQTTTENWSEGISAGETSSRTLSGASSEAEDIQESLGVTYSQSEGTDVNLSSTTGERWGWNLSQGQTNSQYEDRMNKLYGEGSWSGTVGVEAEGSIPGFAKASANASTTVGVSAGGAIGGTNGARRTDTSEQGYSSNGSSSEQRAFGSTTTDSRSQNLQGSYSLTSQRERSFSDTATRDASRTWSFDNGVSESDIVSEGTSVAESQTWVQTTTESTVQGYSGFVPKGQFGIFYRQTTRWVRRAEVLSYDLCGVASYMGELQFNEWTWAPDLALGDQCDGTPPASALPAARCLIQPCGG